MIREFNDADIDDILDVWYKASCLAHPFLDKKFQDQEKINIREIYIPNTKTWVWIQDETIEGFISMMDNEVGAIFVNPDKHGLGIGRKLMDFVSKLHPELEVEVFKENQIGRAFYDHYGFEVINEYIHEETQHALLRMKFTRTASNNLTKKKIYD